MAEQATTRRRVDVVVTNPQGQVLAGQDTRNDTPNRLEIPGGGIQEGESVEQAARREVAEETGYKAKNVKTIRERPLHEQRPGQDEKTYWRRAEITDTQQPAAELGADDDVLANLQFLAPAELALALRQAATMQSNPERTRDARKARAVEKVSMMTPYEQGYYTAMKIAFDLPGVAQSVAQRARNAWDMAPLREEVGRMQGLRAGVDDSLRRYARELGELTHDPMYKFREVNHPDNARIDQALGRQYARIANGQMNLARHAKNIDAEIDAVNFAIERAQRDQGLAAGALTGAPLGAAAMAMYGDET